MADMPGEFYSDADLRCPHCSEVLSIRDNEWWFLYSEDTHDVECPECGEGFTATATATYAFTSPAMGETEVM